MVSGTPTKITDIAKIIGSMPKANKFVYESVPKKILKQPKNMNNKQFEYFKSAYEFAYDYIVNRRGTEDYKIAKKFPNKPMVPFLKFWNSFVPELKPQLKVNLRLIYTANRKLQNWDSVVLSNGKTIRKKDLKAGMVPKSVYVKAWKSATGDVWGFNPAIKPVKNMDLHSIAMNNLSLTKTQAVEYLKKNTETQYLDKKIGINLVKTKQITHTTNTSRFTKFTKDFSIPYNNWVNLGVAKKTSLEKQSGPLQGQSYTQLNMYYNMFLSDYSQLYNYKFATTKIPEWVNDLLEIKDRKLKPLEMNSLDVTEVKTEDRANYVMNQIIDAAYKINGTKLGDAFIKHELKKILDTDAMFNKASKKKKREDAQF
jgi:hypothetical protein